MIFENLRKSILDYAFKGTLVDNDLTIPPLDIKSDIKKGLYDIPTNWKWAKISDVIDISRGASPRPIKEFLTNSNDGINWIKIGDTKVDSKFVESTVEKITKEGASKSRLVHKGDFILSNSMSFGRPYILAIDGCVHDGWLILSNVDKYFFKDYLYYLLTSPLVSRQFSSKATGALVNNLNSDKVGSTLIPIPPIEIQKKIVEKVELVFEILNDLKPIEVKLNELKNEFPNKMKKSILSNYFSNNNNNNHESLEKCIKNIPSKSFQIKQSKIKKDGKYPVVSQSQKVIEGYSDDSEKLLIHEKPYIVYGDHTNVVKLIDFNFVVGADGTKILAIKEGYIDKYLYYNLLYNSLFVPSNSYSRHYKYLKKLPIIKRPIDEQKEIVKRIEEFFPLCDQLDEILKDD